MPERTCSIDGCSKPSYCRSWCTKHYQRWLKYRDPVGSATYRNSGQVCSIEGCETGAALMGWCRKHHDRYRRYGDPTQRLLGEIVDGKRVCASCGVDKLRTPELWMRRRSEPDGLDIYCRECGRPNRKWSLEYRARKRGAFIEQVEPSRVFERDGWTCRICMEPIDPTVAWPDPLSASVDHVVPLAKGGDHSYANCQAAHLGCNCAKGAKEVTDAGSLGDGAPSGAD